jgi:NADH-quinone oxidoreductase subunit N
VNPTGIGQTLPQGVEYVRILPEIVLSLFGMLIMVLDPLVDERRSQRLLGSIALVGSVAAIASALYQSQYPGLGFWGMVKVDAFSTFFHVLVTAITAVVILSSFEYMQVQQIRAGEYYGLILFGAVGMCLMSSAVELVLIFIALEISSISTYVLAGFRRRAAISSEASLKYFLLGSFATAFFLYGVALMFGATGSTSISVIAQSCGKQIPVLAPSASLMFVDWASSRGRPLSCVDARRVQALPRSGGLMSTAPKAAAFAVLLRLVFEANAPGRTGLIWVTAAPSMTLGNVGALVQQNVKRLLAYSSIAHAGYVLVAFAALPNNGVPAAMFYTASYAAMNVGAFAVVSHLAGAGILSPWMTTPGWPPFACWPPP